MNIHEIGVKITLARTASTLALASIAVPVEVDGRETRINLHGFRIITNRYGNHKHSYKVFPPQIQRARRKSLNIVFFEDAQTWSGIEAHIADAYEREMRKEFA